MGNDADVKAQGVGLCDESVSSLGEYQDVDADGRQVGQEMGGVVWGGGRGDWGTQRAVIVADDGDEAPGALPQAADAHGWNSSRAV